MIKKIKTEQLRPGVFVHDFNCDFVDGNILINKTLIRSEKAKNILSSWGIKEVYIDTERGIDVKETKTDRKAEPDAEQAPRTMGSFPTLPSNLVPLREEIKTARSLKKEAEGAIEHAMNDVLLKKDVDVEGAYRLVEKMAKSVVRNRNALMLLTRIRRKDEYTLIHSISVSSMVLAFCNANNVPHETTINLGTGALFHDIGKIQVPSKILNKPGKLDEDEFVIMKKHAEYSADALSGTVDLPEEVYDVALHHHERYDGTGYPHGLKGNEIEFGARLAAICDVYDAITSIRCYKKGMEQLQGLRKLYEWSGKHFDQDLTYKFIENIGVYPVGTCVRLENHLSAVVTDTTNNVLQPIVRIFFNDKTESPLEVEEIDLSSLGVNIAGYESSAEWGVSKKNCFNDIKRSLSPLAA